MAPKDGTAPAAGGPRRGSDADAPLRSADQSSNAPRPARKVVGGHPGQRDYDPAELERRLEHWLAFASAGYHLAPVRIRRDAAGKKRPRFLGCTQTIGWADLATTDPDTITRWLHRWGPDVGMVIACQPSGLFAVDLDLNPGAEVDALGWWARYGLPVAHMVVDTPSGGAHHYWRQHPTKPLPNTAGAIAPGVDTRGIGQTHGGFVFAPGTYVIGEEDAPWRLMDPLLPVEDLPVVPDDVAELIPEQRRARRAPRAPGQAGLAGANGAGHQLSWLRAEVERLRDRLVALPAAPGHGFRYALLGASMMAGRLVVAEGGDDAERELATEYLSAAVRQVWGDVDEDDAEWIATGLDDGEADPFTITPEDDAELDPESEPDEYALALERELSRLRLREDAQALLRAERAPALARMTGAEFLAAPQPVALVPGMLYRDSLAQLFGPPGSAKSFLALDIALRIATGSDWDGGPLEAENVHYVMAEGQATNAARANAWLVNERLGADDLGRFVAYREPILLTEAGVRQYLHDVATDRPALIVLDTKNAMMDGDENSAADVAVMVRAMHLLRRASGACVLLIDHTGTKDETRSRGSNAVRAAVETQIRVRRDECGDVVAAIERDKASPEGTRTWRFRLHTVEPAAVLVPATAREVTAKLGDDWWDLPRTALPGVVAEMGGAAGSAACDMFRALLAAQDRDGLTASQMLTLVNEGPRKHSRTQGYAGVALLSDADVLVPVTGKSYRLGDGYLGWLQGPEQ